MEMGFGMKTGAPLSLEENGAPLESTLTVPGYALTRRGRRGIMAHIARSAALLPGALPGDGEARLQPMARSLFRRLIRAFFPFIARIIIRGAGEKVNPRGKKKLCGEGVNSWVI